MLILFKGGRGGLLEAVRLSALARHSLCACLRRSSIAFSVPRRVASAA